MKRYLWLSLLAVGAAQAEPGRVAGGKHDLSSAGPGKFRAASESDPCIFCHASHRAGATLNNRPDGVRAFKPYQSSTMKASVGDPTGSSRICLSCHDGTIALGKTLTRDLKMSGGDRISAGHRGFIGTDLRGSHPVSFMPPGGKREGPSPGDRVRLDRSGEVQCTSCHDPHSEYGGDPKTGMFLVKPLAKAALCASCHSEQLGGAGSSHASSATPVRALGGEATTVAEAGCVACHDLHAADERGRLLRPGRTDDETCVGCHASQFSGGDIARELNKPFAHVSTERGGHDDAESPTGVHGRTLPERSVGARRHVTCVDCHEPHSSRSTPAMAPIAKGTYGRTWGVSLDGQRVAPVTFEYEVCLKCHGDSANKPRDGGAAGIQRAEPDTNLRLVFAPSAVSFHPIASPGLNPSVPGLKSPLTAASLIYCTDCHASNESPAAGGAGTRGPHGSVFPFLLEREYRTADRTPESPASYALCYKCHDRDTLMSEASNFSRTAGAERALHKLHVQLEATPCSACHDAHGVSREAGRDDQNLHLISFDLAIVGKVEATPARYSAGGGPGTRSCNLTCHSTSHADATHRY